MNNLVYLNTEIRQKAGFGNFQLTGREQEVQRLITIGMSNKMIGRKLGIAEGTVKIHVKNLMRKLNVHTRLEVAVLTMAAEPGNNFLLRSK